MSFESVAWNLVEAHFLAETGQPRALGYIQIACVGGKMPL